MPIELLRKSVTIEQTNDGVSFSHPSWSINSSHLDLCSAEIENLRKTIVDPKLSPNLELTNFFTTQHLYDYSFLSGQKDLTAEALINVSRACANEWFGVLYGHPWWVELAHNRNDIMFRNWVMQNYGLSKMASISSAIAAQRHENLKPFFISSILEEYDHHKVFFNVPNDSLGIDANFYAGDTTLGIKALQMHLSHLAKTDILGLLIFYYFQECSAYLVRDFRKYYSHLEKLYGIDSFFDGWLSHVDVDDELNHGREVEVAIEQYGSVSSSHLQNSLENAWLAVALLLSDYDSFIDVHPESMTEDLFACEVEKIALEGLSVAIESQRILDFGLLLKSSQTAENYTGLEVEEDAWRIKAIDVLAKLFGEGELSLAELEKTGNVISTSNSLFKSIISRRPPNLLSGGTYFSPQFEHECSS